MKNKFSYDYSNLCIRIGFLLFIPTLILSIFLVFTKLYEIALCMLIPAILFLSYIVYYARKGIKINYQKMKIVIIDDYGKRTLHLQNVKSVHLKEIKKENRSSSKFFLIPSALGKQEMVEHEYIYNNGRVFNIIFHLKDGSSRQSYFGWMYKERSLKKVDKIVKKLENFIEEINNNCNKK